MKKQLKKDLQQLINKIATNKDKENEILKELQEMCASKGLPRFCSWEHCANLLENNMDKYTAGGCNTTYGKRARYLLQSFYKLEGEIDVLYELGQYMANSGFWKKDE